MKSTCSEPSWRVVSFKGRTAQHHRALSFVYVYTFFVVLALVAVALECLRLWLSLFGPDLAYRIKDPPQTPLDAPYFRSLISVLTQAEIQGGNQIEVLTNGPYFYEAELQAIASAQKSVNLEAYIFHKGEISRRYVLALAERARAGVHVKLTLDYIGSLSTPLSYLKDLLEAGGRVHWYHPLRLVFLLQLNNRTHRELLIIDGQTAFIGGAGIADCWDRDTKDGKRWRDTVLRVQGPAVSAIQSVFAQNWLRVAGEILTGELYFQFPPCGDHAPALVIGSTPSAGSTQARILFQTLIASAKKCVYVSTPYFLPDRSARSVLIRAVRDRGLEVIILTPGDNNDQKLTRASSRELYGTLLKNGVRIFEYGPSMIHVKALMIDDCWTVVGSTNFDYRSFNINDEVNLAVLDTEVCRRMTEDFRRDLSVSKEISYQDWRRKGRFRLGERIFSLLERQE